MVERLGRCLGFTWYALTAWMPWGLTPFLVSIESVISVVPGFFTGLLAAQSLHFAWRFKRSTRRIARGRR